MLIPKTKDLSSEKDYRPITCFNTSYKIYSGILAQHVKKHVICNDLWDKSQMGTCEKILGIVDKLLIDNATMGKVRDHHSNLAIGYYYYQKAYDIVHYDRMLRVYEWVGIERKVRYGIEEIMKKWETCLEVRNGNKLLRSRWVDIKKGFLQGNTYTPVGFCCTEIPVMMFVEESDGWKICPPGKRETKRTRSLFINDLKTYQQNHQKPK